MSTLQAFGLAPLIAFSLALAGMAALALAMDRHHEQLTGARDVPVRRRMVLRGAGALLLAASALPCLAAWGPTVGAVAWLGWLSAGALAAVALISAAPRWAARTAGLLAAGAVLGLVWAFR